MNTVASTGLAGVTSAMEELLPMVGTIISTITGQPILLAFLAVSFVGIGVSIFKKLKGAAK